jgi:hypothetical protein
MGWKVAMSISVEKFTVAELGSEAFEPKSKFPPSSSQKNPKIVHKSHCKYLI